MGKKNEAPISKAYEEAKARREELTAKKNEEAERAAAQARRQATAERYARGDR